MQTKCIRWSPEETEYLRANAGVLTDPEMAHRLTMITGRNITIQAIHEKRRYMRIRKKQGGGRKLHPLSNKTMVLSAVANSASDRVTKLGYDRE